MKINALGRQIKHFCKSVYWHFCSQTHRLEGSVIEPRPTKDDLSLIPCLFLLLVKDHEVTWSLKSIILSSVVNRLSLLTSNKAGTQKVDYGEEGSCLQMFISGNQTFAGGKECKPKVQEKKTDLFSETVCLLQ